MPLPASLLALTAAIRSGDGPALATLYAARFEELYAAARRATRRDESFCLDVVQETFVRVIRSVPIVETERELDAWLSVVVRSAAMDLLRGESRRTAREQVHAEQADGSERATARVARAAEPALTPDDCSRAFASLAALSDGDVDLLTARFRFGWTLGRIGAALGLRPGAVDGRISRLLARIRKEIGDGH